jgi:hypothetical protein
VDPSAASSWVPVSRRHPALVSSDSPVTAALASAPEVYFLELVNRTRWNPRSEGERHDALDSRWGEHSRKQAPDFFGSLGDEYASLCAQQPLAMHPGITRVAHDFSARITAGECWVEGNPHICDGQGPADRGRAAGLDILRSENLGQIIDGAIWPAQRPIEHVHFELMVDHNNASHDTHPLGHRLNILKPWNVAGMALHVDPTTTSYVSGHAIQNFGSDAHLYVTGVVYADRDGDLFYSLGEGLEGVTITLSTGESGITGPAGNYAIPVQAQEIRSELVEFILSDPDSSEKMRGALKSWWSEYREAHESTMLLQVMASGGPFGEGVLRSAEIIRPVQVQLEVRTRSEDMTGHYGWPTVESMQMGGARWVPGNIKVDFRVHE